MSLVDLVLDVHRQLVSADLSHAFGGALALAYVADPRGTLDVDVNVFAPLAEIDFVLDAFAPLGLRPELPRQDWEPMAGIRLGRETDPYPVDVFPSLDERYDTIERRCVQHPFGPDAELLPFLSADDLAVFKLSFGREKDWVDLRAMVRSGPLDLAYVETQLIGLRGPGMHPRMVRMRNLARTQT